ncbi:hypothetical protein RND71_002611 [Anisodus tanguticus]|uniref:Uncharacterized protein n=1 Tax=Anisodus tanguticus TaxID=243964 RepID=A0AAE1T2X0_9SOLA|nr:hypothetical protein RND71_002611 [Anisodus tanguticus]
MGEVVPSFSPSTPLARIMALAFSCCWPLPLLGVRDEPTILSPRNDESLALDHLSRLPLAKVLGGPPLARPSEELTPPEGNSQTMEGNSPKPSYANTITKDSTSAQTPIRHERERVVAKHTSHNGIPAIIFKRLEYFGIMTAECQYTLVGRL